MNDQRKIGFGFEVEKERKKLLEISNGWERKSGNATGRIRMTFFCKSNHSGSHSPDEILFVANFFRPFPFIFSPSDGMKNLLTLQPYVSTRPSFKSCYFGTHKLNFTDDDDKEIDDDDKRGENFWRFIPPPRPFSFFFLESWLPTSVTHRCTFCVYICVCFCSICNRVCVSAKEMCIPSSHFRLRDKFFGNLFHHFGLLPIFHRVCMSL